MMKTIIKTMRLSVTLLLLAASMAAQVPPAKKRSVPRPTPVQVAEVPVSRGPFPLRSIQVDGLKVLSPAQVIAATGLPVGTPVTNQELDAALQKLLTCGYFDRAAYRYAPSDGGYALTWEVQEVSVFYPVVFADLPVKESEARKILAAFDPLFGPKIPGTEEVLRKYAAELNRALNLRIETEELHAKVAANDKNELFVEVRANRPLPTVYKVDFKGNKLLSAEELRAAASASAVGLVYDEARFRQVLDLRIIPIFEARGRLRVKFPSITVTPSPGLNAVDAVVTVEEGEEYKLRNVVVEGVGDSADEMKRAGEFLQDQTANMTLVAEGGRKIQAAVRRNGFLDTKISESRTIDDKDKVVDVKFTVEPGERYKFDKLEIKGLDILSEPEIRKMWGMKTGAPFNPEYPDAFLDKVRADGVFDNLGETKSRYDINEAEHSVIVTLTFKGAPPPDPKKARQPGGIPPF